MIERQICSLSTRLEIIDFETNRVPSERGKPGFAIVQDIKQQACLELVRNFGAGKTVDKTLDSYFFQRKSNRRHGRPPRRQMGLESLAVPAADSSGFWRRESSEVVSNHRDRIKPAPKHLSLVKQLGAVRKNSADLRGGCILGIDSGQDETRTRSSINDRSASTYRKSAMPFASVDANSDLGRLNGHDEFFSIHSAVEVGEALSTSFPGLGTEFYMRIQFLAAKIDRRSFKPEIGRRPARNGDY